MWPRFCHSRTALSSPAASTDDCESGVAPSATLVRLVLLPATNEAMAFEFGDAGCHTVTLALDSAAMSIVFETAGVSAPFGRTFYQLPALSI